MAPDQRDYPFVQVDVFTDHMFGGNQLAVFPDAARLSTEQMQAIAKEMNLAETTFLFAPADNAHAARVRIFTPARELQFAGHPTLGTAYVIATQSSEPGGKDELVLEEGVGPIRVRLEGERSAPSFLWMSHPPATFGPSLEPRGGFARALSLAEENLLPDAPVCTGSTGTPFLYVPLKDRHTVDSARLDVPALLSVFDDPEPVGVFVFAPEPPGRVYSRMFAPHTADIPEDPATGSASGPLGAYLVRHGIEQGGAVVTVISEQGTKMGRQSFIHIRVRREDGTEHIEVGGSVVPVLDGVLHLAADS